MTGGEINTKLLSQLRETLDIYGADRTRWPVGVRHQLSSFISESCDAQRLLAEEERLDRLLDAVPGLSSERLPALAERIVAEAARQPRIVSTRELVPHASKWRLPARERGLAAAALAASLMLGILAGQTQVASQATDYLIGDASTVTQTAQIDDADGFLDEDLL